MAADLLHTLLRAAIVASVAVVMVWLLRKSFRAFAGAQAAGWLWVLVPALTLMSLLPARTPLVAAAHLALPTPVRTALGVVQVPTFVPDRFEVAVLAPWMLGTLAMLLLLLRRQFEFSRALGGLDADANGCYRSAAVREPLLLGVWRPRIVVPVDFETRYSPDERELILAHERAHLSRCDAISNLLASGWLCVFWFNPLMHFALRWLRMDQELACDAMVVGSRSHMRRSYATALLKTQMATQAGWTASVGCHWQSEHPLMERIAMLHKPLPRVSRYFAGMTLVGGLTLFGGYAVWASESPARSAATRIFISLKLTTAKTEADGKTSYQERRTQYLVNSGVSVPGLVSARPTGVECVPFLPNDKVASLAARGIPVPAAGQILLDCKVMTNGELAASAAVITADGQPAAIETRDRTGTRHFRIDVIAATTPQGAEAARKAFQ